MALDFSDEMGMGFPNVTQEEDTDSPVSNAHGTNSGLLNVFDGVPLSGPGDHCDNSTSQGSTFSISYLAWKAC